MREPIGRVAPFTDCPVFIGQQFWGSPLRAVIHTFKTFPVLACQPVG